MSSILRIVLSDQERDDGEWTRFSSAISKRFDLCEASSEITALEALADTDVRYVLVADSDITSYKHKLLRDCLVEFAKDGGIVIHACLFGIYGNALDQTRYFKHGWGVPWKAGRSDEKEVFLNPYGQHDVRDKDLPPSYTFHGLFLRNVPTMDAVYVPASKTNNGSVPQVPIALTKIGSGFMGFVGDSTSSKGFINIVLAMLGLPDDK